jgi:hypothetical protein
MADLPAAIAAAREVSALYQSHNSEARGHVAAEALFDLLAALDAAQPVAWQYRHSPEHEWQNVPAHSARCLRGDGDEYRALYAAPQAPPAAVPIGRFVIKPGERVESGVTPDWRGVIWADGEPTQNTALYAAPPAAATPEALAWQKAAGLPNPPTEFTLSFRQAIEGAGDRAYTWKDKPHRLVFDLCSYIERIEVAPPAARKGE